MSSRLRMSLALVATGWLLGILQAIFEGISYGLAGRAIPWHAMTWNWLSYGASALLLPWLVARAQANPFTRHGWARQLAALLGRVLTAVAIEATIWMLLRKGYEWAGGKPYDLTNLWRGLLDGILLSNVYLFTSFSIGASALRTVRLLREKELAAARLESELATARLRLLKAQLNPHFLFNALHTVSALVDRAPREAHRTISRLSEFLRVLLDSAGQEEVTLEQELEHLALYVGIQETRFRDRLRVTTDVPESLHDVAVPHLILQPLVENAIQHGAVARRLLQVWVRASAAGGRIELEVEDDGRGLSAPTSVRPHHHGVGLSSARARLQALFGPGEHLVLAARPGGGAVARIRLPDRRLPLAHAGSDAAPAEAMA